MHTALRNVHSAVATISDPRRVPRREDGCPGAGTEPVAVVASGWRTPSTNRSGRPESRIPLGLWAIHHSIVDSHPIDDIQS